MRLDHEALRALARAMMQATGSEAEEAEIVSGHLVEANLLGHDSHGIGLLPVYLRRARAGEIRLNGHAVFVMQDGPLAVVDGGMAYGQVIAREAMSWAIGAAGRSGIAVVALRNSHHIGRVGAYGEQVAAAGLASIHFANVLSGLPGVAPFGGTDGRMSTNPVCITVPRGAGQPPVVLDFATSAIAAGKIRVAYNAGERLPPDTLLDAQGRPSTDPADFWGSGPKGALLPFGAYKGSGLALMCEILGGALTGSGTNHPGTPKPGPTVNGMLSFVLDPARFGSAEAFEAEVAALIAHVKASPPQLPERPVLVAGEIERERAAQRRREGLPIDAQSWAELRDSALALGLPAARLDAVMM